MPSGPAHDTAIWELTSIVEPIELGNLFSERQPLEVELGAGDGSFVVRYAGLHRGRNFIAVERLLGRIRKVDRKTRRAGLRNLRAVRIESSYLIEYLLPAGSASALHVYFPDPWPKRKHWKHRLVNEQFPGLAKRVLVPGGTVYLRTDDEPYYEQMQSVFAAASAFQRVETPAELLEVVTDFEAEFHKAGIATLRAAYRLVD
jgi:tRNA (guanine-N7-)-methyltransferase